MTQQTPSKPMVGTRNGERLTGNMGLVQPRQDGLGAFLRAQRTDLRVSPRAEMADLFKSGVMEPYINRNQLNDPDFRRQLIRDAMNCVLDIKSGRGSMWFTSGQRRFETETAIQYVWEGIQDVLAHVAGGDLNFLTQCLNEYTEITLEFITPKHQWVEQGKERDLPLATSISGQTIGKQIPGPMTEEDVRILAGQGDLNALSASPPAISSGEVIQMGLTQAEPQLTTYVVGEGATAKTYVLTEPIFPREMQGSDGEFIMTTLSQLLTRGPLVETLLYHVAIEKQVKGSTQLQPVWDKVISSLRAADQMIIGNWLANVRSESETPRAGRMIIQWATSMINASRMAEEVTSINTKPMDGIIDTIIAQTEFFPGVLLEKGNDEMGAQVLREYMMQLFNQVSRAGVLETLSSVIGDPLIETGKGEWLKELTKVLRDGGYDSKQNEPANMIVRAGTPLGHVKMSQMETGAVPISGDEKVRMTVASALCGTVATYPKGKGELVKMALPQLLVLEPRKAKTPGRPLLMMTEDTTTTDQQARISAFLLNQANIMLSMIGHANEADPPNISRGETLNLQQRVATMVNLWANILSERPNEPVDHVKNEARGRFLGTLLSWHLTGHTSDLVRNSIEQALRIVGLRWPDEFVKAAVQQVIDRGPADGTNTRKQAKKLAATLGIIHPDLTLNLGRAQSTVTVAEVEGKTEKKGKSQTDLKVEMGIHSDDVFTKARRYLVAAESAFVTNIAQSTQDIGQGERRKMRESILGALADLNFIYEIGVLAEDGSPQSIIALAHSLQAYNRSHGIENVPETAHTFTSINHIITAAREAGIQYELPTRRMGNKQVSNPTRLPEMGGRHPVLDEQHVRRVVDYARNIFTFAETLLGDSFDIIDGFSTNDERKAIGIAVGTELKQQLAYILKNYDAPHSYHKLLAGLQERIREIDGRVRTVSKSIIGANSLLTMGDAFEASFAEQIKAMDKTIASQLVDQARTKEEEVRKALDLELSKIFTSSGARVTAQGKERLRLAKEIMATVLSPLGVNASSVRVESLMDLFMKTKPADGTPDELGRTLNQALTMIGAGGFGYALGTSKSGGQVQAGVGLANTLQSEHAQLSAEQVSNYREAARIKREAVMASLERIYVARMEYYDQMEEAATAINATTILEGLRLQQKMLLRQYGEVERAIDGVFGMTEQLVDIQVKGIGLELEEAQETLAHIMKFMHITRPIVRNIVRMANDQWGIDIDAGMAGWDEPEAVLGIKVVDVQPQPVAEAV